MEGVTNLLTALGPIWWPITFILIVVILREGLGNFLQNVTEFSFAGASVQLRELKAENTKSNIDTISLQILMAESRVTELEMFSNVGLLGNSETLNQQADMLRKEIEALKERKVLLAEELEGSKK